MKFYALHEGIYEGIEKRIELLRAACKEKKVEFICLDSLTCDYTSLPKLGRGDLLYNFARGSLFLETLLLNKDVTTFYIRNPELPYLNYDTTGYTILHSKSGLQEPKTIFHLTNERTQLKKYVKYLGGFPIVIKATGTTRGIGTLKIETWHSLYSTVDYLMTTGDKFIMHEFINSKSGCRVIVLGNEVIAAADFEMNTDDFRNAAVLSEVKYTTRDYPADLKELAVKATHLANVEFSGVDFLEDKNGNYFLLEINFPTGFAGLIDICSVDIPGKMVEYLIKKSELNRK